MLNVRPAPMIGRWRTVGASAVAMLLLCASTPLLGQALVPVSVIGLDYAFQAPDTLPPGPAIFSLVNRGSVRHEVVIYVANEGRTVADYLQAKTPQERQQLGRAVGLILAEPGQPALARLALTVVKGQS